MAAPAKKARIEENEVEEFDWDELFTLCPESEKQWGEVETLANEKGLDMTKALEMWRAQQRASGYIPRADVRKMLLSLRDKLTDENIEKMTREAEHNGDGCVNPKDLVTTLMDSVTNVG